MRDYTQEFFNSAYKVLLNHHLNYTWLDSANQTSSGQERMGANAGDRREVTAGCSSLVNTLNLLPIELVD
jgi:hypothetical protein